MKFRFGFTVVEIVIALVIIAVGFLPIYNLFRTSSAGTMNTVHETIATNYASDLINLCKDIRYSDVKDKVSEEKRSLMGQKGREYVIKNHDYRVLAKKYLNLMQTLLVE